MVIRYETVSGSDIAGRNVAQHSHDLAVQGRVLRTYRIQGRFCGSDVMIEVNNIIIERNEPKHTNQRCEYQSDDREVQDADTTFFRLNVGHVKEFSENSPLATSSTARNFAERLRGFSLISSRVATIGFFVKSVAVPSFAIFWNASFTMRSSSE